ncbi:type IV pili methyl-accepting chemotaxis transducer N-terminal domain-containing protein [Diaphorobacter sp. ED-3]|uniref:type IV pili methyl-accepting chemotaxis transducer N-terminal domain-containing protein n=1 Tax=Diaphorobacter sp. ED-3 TaxID=3016636 RepID=UPI0022DE5324|nr:type IV pili methyl-accepting chemotaxis transducer N-terminal domain-containing protein [Diaphorobacter sp. ED-3]
MRNKSTLSTKLLAMGTVFLLVALASIGFTLWVTWKLEGGAAAVNEAGRLRMNMLRMVLAQQNESPQEFARLETRFNEGLELLRTGDPARPLFVPWSDDTRERYEHIRRQWLLIENDWKAAAHYESSAEAVARADAFVLDLDSFVEAIEIQIVRLTAVLHLFHLFMVALAIGSAVAFMALSYLLVLNPVTRLQQALARLRKGDLGTRLEVEADDEFGQLTAGFNLMAHALQTSHEDLERKVREKTATIEVRNQRLAALYAVSALAAEAGSLEELTQGFVQQIRRVAGCDAAAVRWSDEANERYVLLASDGLPQSLVEHEHCVVTGACECGQAQGQARMRVIPIMPVGGLQLPHCREAGFETVVSIPVQMHQRLLGEVTLLYRSPLELSAEMRELLSTMAHHLATSMESLRASALEREAAVAQERSLIARELHDSIAQSLAFLKIQTQLLRDAVAKDNTEARDRSMAELDTGVRECYADVRELLVHFRTRTQDEDIEAALRATLSKFEHQTGAATALSMAGHGLPLAQDVQIQVLHILQEALSNVRKHADARRVELRVQRHPRWRFEVQDDGRGFDPDSVPPDSLHVGLGIMRERAQRIGAHLELVSRPGGGGTCVVLELPPTTREEPALPFSLVSSAAA